ncbi:hypothetical protein [Methylomonas albis]|nr:hypothetical protein [Methylomonas albis]
MSLSQQRHTDQSSRSWFDNLTTNGLNSSYLFPSKKLSAGKN